MGISGSSARREPLLSSPSCPGADFRRLLLRLGSGPSASLGVRCLVGRGFLGPYQFSGVESIFFGSQEFGGPCKRSVMIRSENTTVVSYINYQGRNSLAFPVLSGNRALGVVSSEGHSSPSLSHSGEDNLVADFLSRGKFLPSEWTLSPLIFQTICQVLNR